MKIQLVMAATFAALCSHAAFAASKGGDTWSELHTALVVHPTPPRQFLSNFKQPSPESQISPEGSS